MIDIKQIRENPEHYRKTTAAKRIDPSIIDELLKADELRRKIIVNIDALRAKRNAFPNDPSVREEAKKLKEEIKHLETKQMETNAIVEKYSREIPNPACNDVKIGKDDTENDVIRKWGNPRSFDFVPKDHMEIGQTLEIIDVERASKVSGSRFGYLKGDAVLLEFALVQFAFHQLLQKKFIPVIPPVLIKKETMAGMGYLEHGGEDDMYILEKDNLVLVGTSEQSIGPMHTGEILNVSDLPRRYVGFSHCFRREAGSYGKDTRGILRVHQFDKIEMFSYTIPEKSDEEHEFLLSLEEMLLQKLDLPYRVIKMCTGDLGAPAARKYDLEAWMPGQMKYREVTSTSNCTDFQSRRLHIKYRDGNKTEYVHMLNGTAFAVGRILISIVENYQQKNGDIVVPEILRGYMGKDKLSRG